MSDLLDSAVEWLDSVRRDELSQTVVYERDGCSVTIPARPGQTEYDSIDANGFPIQSIATDFLVSASGLLLHGILVEPAVGDRITWLRGDATEMYEVLEPAGMACFRPDPTRRQYRIHTRRISI